MNALKRLLIALFRGSDSGQALVEYLTIAGACALVGIAGFTRYGQAVKDDLSANAKHIEGEGLPNTEGILGSLGAEYNEIPGWCVKPNYCFAAGTPVQTASGDRAIESIVVGDRVWARDVTTGAIALRSVVNTYRTARVPVVDLELSVGRVGSEQLTVTRGHRFWVEGPGWVPADALGTQPLWSTEGATTARLNTDLLRGDSEFTTVYNLEVSEFHSYFVGHSHVLVHNGDDSPEAGGCAPGTPPTADAPATEDEDERPQLECGETGSYARDLGAGRSTRGNDKKLDRDHIPSGKALQVQAVKLMDQLAAKLTEQTSKSCRKPKQVEQRQLDAARAEAVKPLQNRARDTAFAIMEPPVLHKAGRTNGNKNKPLYNDDSGDLGRAAQDDVRELEKALAAGVLDHDPDCRDKILAALTTIELKTTEQYDAELKALAQEQLERAGFTKILEGLCSGR